MPGLRSHPIGIQPTNLLINGKGSVHNVRSFFIDLFPLTRFSIQFNLIRIENNWKINNWYSIGSVSSTKRSTIQISLRKQYESRLSGSIGNRKSQSVNNCKRFLRFATCDG